MFQSLELKLSVCYKTKSSSNFEDNKRRDFKSFHEPKTEIIKTSIKEEIFSYGLGKKAIEEEIRSVDRAC